MIKEKFDDINVDNMKTPLTPLKNKFKFIIYLLITITKTKHH